MASKTKPASERAVQLKRHADGFVTQPMPESEAKAVIDGYPGEYEIVCASADAVTGTDNGAGEGDGAGEGEGSELSTEG